MDSPAQWSEDHLETVFLNQFLSGGKDHVACTNRIFPDKSTQLSLFPQPEASFHCFEILNTEVNLEK